MGLTTSCEAIERHASPVEIETEVEPTGGRGGTPALPRGSNVVPDLRKAEVKDAPSQGKKKRSASGDGTPKPKKKPKQAKSTGKSPGKASKVRKTTPKKATPKKLAAGKKVVDTTSHVDGLASPECEVVASPPINAHRARILVGKQALAAIKDGTRIYIKSGEGNGGDTWWDSGIIQKVHERGKPYEVEWQRINNRGEEVDTGVEKRIGLPVTYSLAGVAAEAIQRAPQGTEAAALARKSVLADARIGSWCIKHPEEPWGMLDPFGEDSSTV